MKTKADVKRILRAGRTAAENKAYLPVNMVKDHPKEISLDRLISLLKEEVTELENAVQSKSTKEAFDESGDVVYLASMIAYKLKGV